MRRLIFGLFTHGITLAIGFAFGVYMLPILIAPDAPTTETLRHQAQSAPYNVHFIRELRGSDFLHWGEGKISITPTQIIHEGSLAAGPDYKLYLLDRFVEHEDEFVPIKASAQLVGDVKTFEGFIVDIPHNVDISKYNTVLIWCETFSEFITAAKYR